MPVIIPGAHTNVGKSISDVLLQKLALDQAAQQSNQRAQIEAMRLRAEQDRADQELQFRRDSQREALLDAVRQRQFQAREAALGRQFQGGESAAERALRENLQGEGFEFQGGENRAQRLLQRDLQSEDIGFRREEGERGRSFQGEQAALGHLVGLESQRRGFGHAREMQGEQQTFEGGQRGLDRQHQSTEAGKQREFAGAESAAQRAVDAYRFAADMAMKNKEFERLDRQGQQQFLVQMMEVFPRLAEAQMLTPGSADVQQQAFDRASQLMRGGGEGETFGVPERDETTLGKLRRASAEKDVRLGKRKELAEMYRKGLEQAAPAGSIGVGTANLVMGGLNLNPATWALRSLGLTPVWEKAGMSLTGPGYQQQVGSYYGVTPEEAFNMAAAYQAEQPWYSRGGLGLE